SGIGSRVVPDRPLRSRHLADPGGGGFTAPLDGLSHHLAELLVLLTQARCRFHAAFFEDNLAPFHLHSPDAARGKLDAAARTCGGACGCSPNFALAAPPQVPLQRWKWALLRPQSGAPMVV